MNHIPRPEHPRPQFYRESWLNLNGTWDFLFDFGNTGVERELHLDENFDRCSVQPITVPFCPESTLSGIGYTDFISAVWYRRRFTLIDAQRTGRVILHFGAVDYRCTVWINGQKAGDHTGGYSSFEFDITGLVCSGENTVTVYAEDDLRSETQPFGKQSNRYHSYACSYTRTTGIWQTVWLEFVPEHYIKSAKITPLVDEHKVLIQLQTSGGSNVCAAARFDGEPMGCTEAPVTCGNAVLMLDLHQLHLWDVGQPNLYDLTLTLDGGDCVQSYFGMRKVELFADGLHLNGRPVFLRTILDQGFNPDGIYTGPSDEFLKHDIELTMDLGFNGARLHQRVFEERTLYWADQLGYLVWGEYANGSMVSDGRGIGYFLPEWMEVLNRDYSHPSIIGWCPFNESYWSHDIDGICQQVVYDMTKTADPYRPVIDASGGLHVVTDMFDIHDYEQDPSVLEQSLAPMLEDPTYIHNPLHNNVLARHRYGGQPYWISEYGGTFWNPELVSAGIPGKEAWGYGNAPRTEEEFAARYEGLTTVLLKCPRVCGLCYTQLTDVEQEQNGLYRYDRSRKFSDFVYDRIRKANQQIAAIEQEVRK